MRILPVLMLAACWALGSAAAPAQIFEVVFHDEKTAKKYKKDMVEIEGRLRYIGELRSGELRAEDATDCRGEAGRDGASVGTRLSLNA